MRVLIVEDELVIAQRLERLLRAEAGDELASVDVEATLAGARQWLGSHPVDVVFLDLNLNGRDGFDLVAEAASGAFHTVVVSGHVERALEAFEIGVLDFVPKPFDGPRLRKTLSRLRGARPEHAAASIAVRLPGRVEFVPVAEIAYVRAAGAQSDLVLRDGTERLCSKPLDRLLDILPADFERVHRSYLIRLDEVARIRVQKGSRYSAVLAGGEEVPIGRTRLEAVRRRLEG